jgi:hypothetical protein
LFESRGDVLDMIEAAHLRIPDSTLEAIPVKIRPVTYLCFLREVAAE